MENIRYELFNGDCLEVLKTLDDNSVDSIVTDPPYGLGKQPDAMQMLYDWLDSGHHDVKGKGFMNKEWDAFIPQPALWKEVFRVLKPGGHILCFAGTRTQDLMGLSLRLAGFEIRDCIYWTYGSGMPKSLNISKALDKMDGKENNATQWNGWGTGLKPAVEPCIMARKPINGTVTNNVLIHGTGALNIDGCRIAVDPTDPVHSATYHNKPSMAYGKFARKETGAVVSMAPPDAGRWPANLIHDGSDEVTELFPNTKCGKNQGLCDTKARSWKNSSVNGINRIGYDDSASRFFYCTKASKKDREEGLDEIESKKTGFSNGAQIHGEGYDKAQSIGLNRVIERKNIHPTVKPTSLMQYLCKLITPPDGIILDPFMGSGSTGKAALLENFKFIGIELEPEYYEIAKTRIEYIETKIEQETSSHDMTAFLDGE